MTCRHEAARPPAALRGAATCLFGAGLVAAAMIIWAIPSAAAPAPPRGPASNISVTCGLITTPESPVPCTVTGLLPSESPSVLVAGTTQVAAPPANAAGASAFTVPIPPGTGSRIVQVTAPQSHRTTSTSVVVSDQVNAGPSAASTPASAGGGPRGHVSSLAHQPTTVPPRALIAILVAVVGIVVLATRKRLVRMKA